MSPQPHGTVNALHLLNGEQYSGLERVVDHLAEHAADFGYRLHLVFLKEGLMAERMHSRAAAIHSAPMRSRLDLGSIPRIIKIARDTSCRLIHSHTVRSALVAYPLSRLLGLPWVHHVHSPALEESENSRLNRINGFAESWLLPRATRLLPVSQGLSRYLTEQYRIDEARLNIVPNGIEVNRHPLPASAARPVTIGAVGLFRPRKGIETLLSAIRQLAQSGLDFNVRLIGEFVDSAYEQAIRGLAADVNLPTAIEFTGFCSDVPSQLENVDIFAMPSLYGEGMPMALLEAMGMERMIVASDIDGIRELVEHEVSGLLVPPGNATALSQALERALRQPHLRARMAKASRLRQQSGYSAASMAKRVFDIYDRCLDYRDGDC